jgi:hypothetical protein
MISFNFLQSVIKRYGITSRYRDCATCRKIGVSNPGMDKRFFSSPNYPHRLSSPPSPLINRVPSFFHGEKRPERDVEHSPPCSAVAKNEQNCTSTPRYTSPCTYRDKFTFF